MFPLYITKNAAESVYNEIINVNHVPKEYVDFFKKYKIWFEEVGEKVEEKIKNVENNKKNEKLNEEFNKLLKKKIKY